MKKKGGLPDPALKKRKSSLPQAQTTILHKPQGLPILLDVVVQQHSLPRASFIPNLQILISSSILHQNTSRKAQSSLFSYKNHDFNTSFYYLLTPQYFLILCKIPMLPLPSLPPLTLDTPPPELDLIFKHLFTFSFTSIALPVIHYILNVTFCTFIVSFLIMFCLLIFLQMSITNQKNTDASIKNLEVQVGQLTKL